MKLIFSLLLCYFLKNFPRPTASTPLPLENFLCSKNETDRFKRNEPLEEYVREFRDPNVFMGNRGRREDFQRLARTSEDVFIGNRGRRIATDFMGSRGKKYEFMGNRGRRDEFMGSRGRRFDESGETFSDRPTRFDEFIGNRGRRCDANFPCFEKDLIRSRKKRDIAEVDDDMVVDDKHVKLLYLPKSGKKHFEEKEGKINSAKLFITYNDMSNIVKKSKEKDKDIHMHEPFWAHRGKKRTMKNNVWQENMLFAEEPYWILVTDDTQDLQTVTPLIVSRGKRNIID